VKKYCPFIILLLLIFSTNVPATGVFPVIQLDKNFNQANFLINVYDPPPVIQGCLNKSNEKINCSQQFSLILPPWHEQLKEGEKLTNPRFFVIYNPQTSAELIKNCRNFSSNTKYNATVPYPTAPTTEVPFYWNSEFGGFDCYLYNLPVYNEYLVDQTNLKWYPFDTYEMKFGFSFPYATNFQGLVIIPEEFTITSIIINTTNTTRKEGPMTENIAYFASEPMPNETQFFYVGFDRLPDKGSKFLVSSIIFGLPLIIILFFILSSTTEEIRTRELRITAFYLVIIPLFISMIPFLNAKPTKFTLFDALMLLSIASLGLNFIKDFILGDLFRNRWIRVGLIFILMALFGYLLLTS